MILESLHAKCTANGVALTESVIMAAPVFADDIACLFDHPVCLHKSIKHVAALSITSGLRQTL